MNLLVYRSRPNRQGKTRSKVRILWVLRGSKNTLFYGFLSTEGVADGVGVGVEGVGAWLALVDEGGVVSDLGADVGSLSSRE